MGFASPIPGDANTQHRQEMGRLVQLPVLAEGDTGRCAGMCLASLWAPTNTFPTAGLSLGVGTMSDELSVSHPPQALGQG